jgi:hypothetical protein
MHSQDHDSFLLENWMSILRTSINSKRLLDLTLPGSHDSNTFSIPVRKFGSSLARCQDLTLYQQAMNGIRFFDLRYGVSRQTTNPVDKHGPMIGGSFLRNFEELASFSDLHPGEFIIISFQSQDRLSPHIRKAIADCISVQLGDKLIRGSDMDEWFDISKSTFNDIISRKKNFLVFARDELFDQGDFPEAFFRALGVHNLKRYVTSEWHNVSDEKVLLERLLACLLNKKTDENKLYGSQLILTPQKHPKKLLIDFVKLGIPGVKQLTGRLDREHTLTKFIAKTIDINLGIVLLDFVNLFADVIRMAVLRNSDDRLRIHRVYYGEHDITEEANGSLVDSRFLYMPCLKDLRRRYSPKHDQICVAYSTNNSVSQVFVTPANPKHVFLSLDPLQNRRKRVGMSSWAVFLTSKGFKFEWFIFEPNEHERRELCRLRNARLALMSETKSVAVFNYD